MPLSVLFVHGLEGSPQGSKARFLSEHFDARTPAIDTSDFEGCVRAIEQEIGARRPDVLAGSSFGGAVVLALLLRGAFSGPTLLLAPAWRAYRLDPRLPQGVPVLIAHGMRDTIVDPEDSRALAASGTPGRVELCEVDDEHRLQSLVDTGKLAELVHRIGAKGAG
jgi:alpha-beta hydrolase superfamily lysophospholipase